MEVYLPLLFALFMGLSHAFELDHLIAVSNIVARRDSMILAMKDGAYWGLGHTTTLLIFGAPIIIFKLVFPQNRIFEVIVGIVLIIMGITKLVRKKEFSVQKKSRYPHGFAYSVGLLHGLAGSGSLVLLVMSEISETGLSIAYIFLFGLGSILGMLVAAFLFFIPFTQRMKIGQKVKFSLSVLSSVLCVAYGFWMMYDNL